jgi:hypothetical protein
MMTTITTLTVSGDTYRARTWLKDNGYKWDADAKTWSREVVPAVNTLTGAEGFANANGAYLGTLDGITSTIRCHAKSDRITMTVE